MRSSFSSVIQESGAQVANIKNLNYTNTTHKPSLIDHKEISLVIIDVMMPKKGGPHRWAIDKAVTE